MNDTGANLHCRKCNGTDHSTARSPLCPYNILPKAKVLEQSLGTNYEAFTRKLPFDRCIKKEYCHIKSSITETCAAVREIIFRAKVFINYYVLLNPTGQVASSIFKKNFWYSICQMINGQRITNQRDIPADLITTWDSFRTRHRNASVNITLLPGASQCISEACTEIETLYRNIIVETFEQKLLSFLCYKVQMLVHQ